MHAWSSRGEVSTTERSATSRVAPFCRLRTFTALETDGDVEGVEQSPATKAQLQVKNEMAYREASVLLRRPKQNCWPSCTATKYCSAERPFNTRPPQAQWMKREELQGWKTRKCWVMRKASNEARLFARSAAKAT